jgi:hypothetical protein
LLKAAIDCGYLFEWPVAAHKQSMLSTTKPPESVFGTPEYVHERPKSKAKKRAEECADAIREMLEPGPIESSELDRKCETRGFSKNAIREGRRKAGVTTSHDGFGGVCMASLGATNLGGTNLGGTPEIERYPEIDVLPQNDVFPQ